MPMIPGSLGPPIVLISPWVGGSNSILGKLPALPMRGVKLRLQSEGSLPVLWPNIQTLDQSCMVVTVNQVSMETLALVEKVLVRFTVAQWTRAAPPGSCN